MTWPFTVHLLQGVNGATWLLALGVNTPSLWRLWFGAPSKFDPYYAVAWFAALAQLSFIVRWFVWPHSIDAMSELELQSWAASYAANAAVPIALILLRRIAARGQ